MICEVNFVFEFVSSVDSERLVLCYLCVGANGKFSGGFDIASFGVLQEGKGRSSIFIL